LSRRGRRFRGRPVAQPPEAFLGYMSEQELQLLRLGELLSRVARPHRSDDVLPVDVRTALWQLGFPCTELTSREELISRLWARKRSLLTAMPPGWGGPSDRGGLTPPPAA
jgi:hypothetical protein